MPLININGNPVERKILAYQLDDDDIPIWFVENSQKKGLENDLAFSLFLKITSGTTLVILLSMKEVDDLKTLQLQEFKRLNFINFLLRII